jgi:uncharacterized protein
MKPHDKNPPSAGATETSTAAPSFIRSLTEYWPVRLIGYLGALMLVSILTKLIFRPFVPVPTSAAYEALVTVRNILQAAAMIALYTILVQQFERRTVHETAIRGAATFLFSGITIGAGMIILTYLILYAIGVVQFQTGTGFTGLAIAILKPAVIGTLEELIFRAILFRILQHMTGTLVAVTISAALFGLAHIGNPGVTPLAIAFLSIEMGVFLALVYVLTRSLWIIAGIHMSWNFALGFIFGSDVSGLDSSNGLLFTSFKGHELLTGGAFGAEASIVTLGISVIAILVTARLIHRKNLWQPIKFELRQKRLLQAA